jgi:hypothetical protein
MTPQGSFDGNAVHIDGLRVLFDPGFIPFDLY